jgi:hypothetical protein
MMVATAKTTLMVIGYYKVKFTGNHTKLNILTVGKVIWNMEICPSSVEQD